MNKMTKSNELGVMGEKVVINYLSSQGCVIEQSINKYDNEKDLVSNGRTVEVKTQIPFIYANSLTIERDQLQKCRNVDDLYFVTVPSKGKFFKWSGWLFRLEPKLFEVKTYTTKKGVDMLLINIDQESVQPIQKIGDNYIRELVKYTTSEYFNA